MLDHAAEYRYGVPVEEIQEGIKNGVREVNIDTDLCAVTYPVRANRLLMNAGNRDGDHWTLNGTMSKSRNVESNMAIAIRWKIPRYCITGARPIGDGW